MNIRKDKEQFCVRDHDTFVCGRLDSNNQCVECNRILSKAQGRKRYKINPKYAKNAILKSTYNINLDIYNEFLKNQNGLCAVCKKIDPSRDLSVDHDHSCCIGAKSCGKCIRGLLCSNCNMALGAVSDNAETLKCLIEYLVLKSIK
jgi:hypothetical protein